MVMDWSPDFTVICVAWLFAEISGWGGTSCPFAVGTEVVEVTVVSGTRVDVSVELMESAEPSDVATAGSGATRTVGAAVGATVGATAVGGATVGAAVGTAVGAGSAAAAAAWPLPISTMTPPAFTVMCPSCASACGAAGGGAGAGNAAGAGAGAGSGEAAAAGCSSACAAGPVGAAGATVLSFGGTAVAGDCI